LVEFRDVTKKFADQIAVESISLKLEANKTHVLLGQSGSGKSTLIRIAAGLIAPTKGEVLLNGIPALRIENRERAKVFGFMVQDGGLFPHLNCKDNVMLPARVHGTPASVAQERYQMLAEMVGLPESLFARYPREVSGGQRQRVALVRSLILDPPLIFLDEPLGALDPIVRSDLHKELRIIFRKLNKTVVVVTHDLAEAAYFGDTLTLLRDGHVEQHGPLEDFLRKPKSDFVKKYFLAQKPPPSLKELAEREDA
jgi:osmoprotectant transport system ATP-binding protein